MKKVDDALKIEDETNDRLNKSGGKRLRIDETDGSDDEDERVVVAPASSVETVPSDLNKNVAAKFEEAKKRVQIDEVNSDSESEEPPKKEAPPPVDQPKKAAPPPNEFKLTPPKKEAPPPQPVKKIDLPKEITVAKDKAFEFFTSGNYGEARDQYTKAIEKLELILKSDSTISEAGYLMAILYSNRASCSQNICDYKPCIKDCELGLELVLERSDDKNLRLKLMWKKACALEAIEKYSDAFRVYEALMKIDSRFKTVQSSYNRVRNLLNQNGQLNNARQNQSTSSTTPKDEPGPSYDDLKNSGNVFVKKGEYARAVHDYNKCIDLDPTNPTAYLNRSLCFIKLNQADKAIEDASFVLQKDPLSVKALHRRALAHKLKDNLESAQIDLNRLLRVEPQNEMALAELTTIKELLSKKNTRVEVVKEEKPRPTPVEVKKGAARTFAKGGVKNAYEFLQAWHSIHTSDYESYALLIGACEPTDLPKFIGTKLDDQMLSALIKSIAMISNNNSNELAVEFLRHLAEAKRFDVIKLFLSAELKSISSELLAKSKHKAEIQKLYD